MTHRARHRRVSARDELHWTAASLARVLATCLACASACASVEASNGFGSSRHLLAASKYSKGDDVPLFANKVGPFHNPSEVRARTRREGRCALREGRDYSDAPLAIGLYARVLDDARAREREDAWIDDDSRRVLASLSCWRADVQVLRLSVLSDARRCQARERRFGRRSGRRSSRALTARDRVQSRRGGSKFMRAVFRAQRGGKVSSSGEE